MKTRIDISGASALTGAALLYAAFGIFAREMSKVWGDHAQVTARFVAAFLVVVTYGLLTKRKPTIPRSKKSGMSLLWVLSLAGWS